MAKLVMKVFFVLSIISGFVDIHLSSAEDLSTIEPEASTGCPAPDLRFARPRRIDETTEVPYAQFETTQIYLPEDFTTSDIEIIEKIDIDLSGGGGGGIHTDDISDDKRRKHVDIDPYRIDPDPDDTTGHLDSEDDDEDDDDDGDGHEGGTKHKNSNAGRRNKKRRYSGGRRRRLENENGSSGRGRGNGRFERHAIFRRDVPKINDQKAPLPPTGDVYYVDIAELLKSDSLNKNSKRKLQKTRISSSTSVSNSDVDFAANKLIPEQEPEDKQQDNKFNKLSASNKDIKDVEQHNGTSSSTLRGDGKHVEISDQSYANESSQAQSENDQNALQRVKRKSGKTTGALSRPKGGGDSGSKSTSRKGDKGGYDEEGGFAPVHPDEESSEEEEKSSESSEHSQFSEVSEIKFPGEVGPLGDRRLCKIRCVKGKWVGPLCATNEEDEHGNVKFQPLYKSCHVNRIQPHLLLSYRNISVNVGWDVPHGHSLQARCKDLGLYKLLGESRVLCSNGLWAPRMPSCVPTTLLTNFSDDSPPSIRIKIGSGSGAFEPSGVLAVLPGSTIHLDCMYPRRRGTPEWTWTGWFKQYYTGWSTIPEERATKYRLTIKDIQNQDSGTYTCASPRGLTNSISIIAATSQCPQLPDPIAPLSLRLEGNKLGQRALHRCPLGYTIEGAANSTCLASGNWSSPPPTCQSVQCPPLFLEDPHLSLTELNTSAWGRAVFKCSWGFRLSGPPGLECEPTGVWSGPVPRCRAIQCPQPLVPINGRIDGTSGPSSHRRYAVGALVTFSCTEGHLLVGEASIVCTETGFWSHPPPFCKSQCPYPGDPPNGLIAPLKFHYDPGDLLSVQCRPGFVEYSPKGPSERPKCLPDGNWSGPVPQCRNYEEV